MDLTAFLPARKAAARPGSYPIATDCSSAKAPAGEIPARMGSAKRAEKKFATQSRCATD
jgi:hypothetical protein